MKKTKTPLLLFILLGMLILMQKSYAQGSGYCLDFDGNDDYVSTDFDIDLNVWTIECWVFAYSSPVVSGVSGPIQRGTNFQINWNHEESGYLGTVSVEVGGIWHYASFGTLNGDTWIHLSATYDGETLLAYRDGIPIGNNKNPSGDPSSESSSLALGKHAVDDNFFYGRIDEVRIWNIVRSESDIQTDMYNYNITSSHPDWDYLVAYYQFNETSGTNLPDESSNSYNGTLYNFALSGLTSNWVESGAPLPVELSSFTATCLNGVVLLSWTTEGEINNSGFYIERKKGKFTDWMKIGFIEGHGTVNTPQRYTFEDRNLTVGKYHYRLKQVDHNGNFEYFNLSTDVFVKAPSRFDMSQNYPNPFNPRTKISFELPYDSKVNIRIFDMLGREVATLLDGFKEAGYHTVEFDGSNLSSGMYFYKIETEGFEKVKLMILVK